MSNFARLPTAIEMHIVALIARGDTYDNIRADILARFERGISVGVITAIKKRNSEAIASIKQAVIEKERDDAQGLLIRTHRLIGKRLRAVEEGANIRDSDLVAVSKEMFHQSRTERGLDEDGQKLINPKEKLKELQDMLEENDEIRLERIVFAKRETPTEVPIQPVTAEQEDDRREAGGRLQGGDLHGRDTSDGQEA